jgi:pyridoxamine 5'-phosphate oxidase
VDNTFSALRIDYRRGRLLEEGADPDPMQTFAAWFAEACAAGLHEPNGMTLATAGANGRPSARIVLLKEVDARGFCFFTHYTGRKGQELAENPWAALVFWWGPLERQVRVEGVVEKLSEAESDAYYHSRPKGSRLGAWVAPQSQPIPNRQLLEARWAALAEEYAEQEPARPPFWGGYRLVPTLLEFWQGGPNRLHDRLRYLRADGEPWRLERLAP